MELPVWGLMQLLLILSRWLIHDGYTQGMECSVGWKRNDKIVMVFEGSRAELTDNQLTGEYPVAGTLAEGNVIKPMPAVRVVFPIWVCDGSRCPWK